MLVLSRKKGESIMIGDNVEITVIGVDGDTVRIGISAPKHVEIFRKEIFKSIQQSNQEASQEVIKPEDLSKIFKG
jgi:carbon storage regulator